MPSLAPRKTFFDEFFRDFPLGYSIRPLHGDPLPPPDKIKVEVKENNDNVVVHAEIPGVSKDDIDISIDGNVLTIRADVKQYDVDRQDDKVLHSERYYGSVQRSFSLPSNIVQDKATADYKDGMLVLTLPKETPNGAKKIAVK